MLDSSRPPLKSRATNLILGGGVTGLAAGMSSGLPIYEAKSVAGGICASYYMKVGGTQRLDSPPADEEAYRFEVGGGHWIFGGDPLVHHFIEKAAPTAQYSRVSGVWFPDEKKHVPYPLQNHLRYLGPDLASKALREMIAAPGGGWTTMEQWLQSCFGKTLSEKFFGPFHELYTAGLYRTIAPQDDQKSPIDLARVIDGMVKETPPAGYNTTFRYPRRGLDELVRNMAARCTVHYRKAVVRIDLPDRVVHFADGTSEPYRALVSTLPLNKTLEMAGLTVPQPHDPHTSVLVLNVGGVKGAACPQDHWLYHPNSRSGFHRVGFYSNVDPSFLPRSFRESHDRVSMYIERAYPGGQRPSAEEASRHADSVVSELKEWGFLDRPEVVDNTWIDVAYTWKTPGSKWREHAIKLLHEQGIFTIGRYARWKFQGIAESIADGFLAGVAINSESQR